MGNVEVEILNNHLSWFYFSAIHEGIREQGTGK